jgi:septation ring formation regulator EzrA
MISDTPISDSTAHNIADLGMLCRRLERELNAANAIIRQQQLLNEENLRLKELIKRLEEELIDVRGQWAALVADVVLYEDIRERIKRLEEAGDALCENSNPSRWDSPADAARKLTEQSNWRKAKEAKL